MLFRSDLHCVDRANVSFSSQDAYDSTLVSSGYIRSLTYDHYTNSSDANTFVYKAFVNDLQNQAPSANAIAGGTNTITLPSTYSDSNVAYVGVSISIKNGTSAGDFRTITSYDGVTKVATVNQNWTVTPDANSVFQLNFDIKDVESVLNVNKGSYPATLNSEAKINSESKDSNGNTILQNPTVPEMVFRVGSPYVATLNNTSYTTQQLFRGIAFTSSGGNVTAQLNYEGAYVGVIKHFGTPLSTLSDDLVRQNYVIVVTDKGSNTLIKNGDIISWKGPSRTVSLDDDSSIATFTASDLSPFTADILATVYAETADNTGYVLKGKNLIQANTSTTVTTGTTVNTYTHEIGRAHV